ncbi:MAG: 50S ribosomal protein L30 [Bdellovibrionales bacterium]|nr:50S ribosomal protein L30 [Bdellovibrionales bacterium]
MAKAFRVKLKRSLIGSTQTQKDTIRCLGLRKINDEVVVQDNPANRGQIFKMQHLLEVKIEQ